MELYSQSGEAEVVVVIKASPQVGSKHGETVCCAGIDIYHNWLRLYPISFRTLDDGRKFGRWDKVRFRWRRPKDDKRPESRRVDQDSLDIIGRLKSHEKERFLAPVVVSSLRKEFESGRTLALIRPNVRRFRIEKKSSEKFEAQKAKFAALRKQPDLFNTDPLIPYEPCPYEFKYVYEIEDGPREGTCQDWELEATYYHWSKKYGRDGALSRIHQRWGEEYPSKGMLLAMGTHSQYPDVWLINGVIRLDDVAQPSLF